MLNSPFEENSCDCSEFCKCTLYKAQSWIRKCYASGLLNDKAMTISHYAGVRPILQEYRASIMCVIVCS